MAEDGGSSNAGSAIEDPNTLAIVRNSWCGSFTCGTFVVIVVVVVQRLWLF